MIAIRGAITVETNTKENILKETKILLEEIIRKNNITNDQIVSVIFTATKDLTAAYPAVAARELGIVGAAILCLNEMYVENSLTMCLRVMIQLSINLPQDQAKHVYLKGAKVLRPDLVN
ncbi:chorismate mutase [Vallitalea pronyensis]|uniref:chorismate mutase n=1 Tax=Vallitalea pronyensis TaxID=1348613 RepID=A0A8J8SH67_9FIRM|nr:chorismate mutase [Vallitalea pronyensis]QUI23097.1 chorismate mutase [Vallitalea pronyensis]